MESNRRHSRFIKAEPWIAVALCIAVIAAGILQHFGSSRFAHSGNFIPDLIHLAAAVFSLAVVVLMSRYPDWPRAQRALLWGCLLSMAWSANGLPFDLFRVARLIPLPVDWRGLATRTLALVATLVIAHLALTRPSAASAGASSDRAASWYGYAACVFAMPYPVLRVHWAFGGTLGLGWPGAAGKGFAPLLITIPFLLAAVLSLLLVSPRSWKPRRLLLTAGWTATTIVGMIGPAACWALLSAIFSHRVMAFNGIAFWVPCLFYGSWFLLAIAIGAATHSYQLRSTARFT